MRPVTGMPHTCCRTTRCDSFLLLAKASRLEAALFVASLIDNYNISRETINCLTGSK